MKNCNLCGAEIHEQAVLCIHCGASQDVLPAIDTVSNANVCPNCGNECHKDAIICVNCGQSLVREEHKEPPKRKNTGKGKKVISIIAIVLAVSQILSYLLQIGNQIELLTYGYIESFISYVVIVVSYILILIGFIIGKNNKLPGVGFLLTVIPTAFSLVSCLFDFSFIIEDVLLVFGYVIISVMNILIATMYFSKKDSVRKLWFIPVVLVVVRCVISVFYEYFDSYYFGFDDVLMTVVSYVHTLLIALFASLNAKTNWIALKKKEKKS